MVFDGREAIEALGINRGAFLDSAERLQRRKLLLNPRHDFYIVVPPQFMSLGAPPPTWYIDALMRHEGNSYYVGLLKAAELHGATHQAVMEFQVVAAKRLPKIKAGRNRFVFYYRKDMETVAAGVVDKKTETGSMRVSSPALTALDILRYSRGAGGLDNIFTVLRDIAPQIDFESLTNLSRVTERPVVQRLGYLLDRLGHGPRLASMRTALEDRGNLPWTELDRKEAGDPDFSTEVLERDPRWRVIVRRYPEADE
ncbi:type IV toxin-antitoxin system AbiEi family antitoxin domain-containing protein [Rhizobium leguminosarum]|uniref:type IV toxin-antitoxin system AbiEi family antitoxin domain-containing protein n=1 Tax=Rhizobium leguminosarum TaxID=384 RepID=UPI001FE21029|nr:type IV toxin-antitoxin system AbiEi family antitoxin [Rhizobium leguminosarum]